MKTINDRESPKHMLSFLHQLDTGKRWGDDAKNAYGTDKLTTVLQMQQIDKLKHNEYTAMKHHGLQQKSIPEKLAPDSRRVAFAPRKPAVVSLFALQSVP